MSATLNTRERCLVRLFAEATLSGVKINETALARRAGYAIKSAHVTVSRALQKDKIKKAIEYEIDKRTKNSRISESIILRELRKVALSDTVNVQAKLKALELLGKTLTMFSERTVVVPEVPNLSATEVSRYRQISAALDRPALAAPNIPDDVLDGEVIDDDGLADNIAPGVLDDDQTDSDGLASNNADGSVAGEQPAELGVKG